MSMIGDYVHFHKQNYKEWGINQKGTTPSETWSDTAASFKESMNIATQIRELMQEAQALEKQYNELFYPDKNKVTEQTANFKSAMEAVVQKKLDEEFGLMAGRFNSSNLTVDSTELYEQLREAINSTRERIGTAEIKKVQTAQQLLSQVNLMYNILNDDQLKNVKAAQNKISQAKNQLKMIENNLQAQIDAAGGSSIKISNTTKDAQTLNAIIQEFNRTPLLYNQNGLLFEWILPFIQFQTAALAKEELAKAMEELASDSKVILGDSLITVQSPDLKNAKLTDVDIITNNVKIKTFTTKSKTDVVITYTDNQRQLQKKNVSAKNISNPHVKLVNNTSLYRILTLSNSYNFATHYLNVVTSAKGQRSTRSQIMQANRLMKALILKLGAEGYDANNSAELLIVNNNTEGHIYVYNLKALVYIIQDTILKNKGQYSNIVDMDDSFTINQTFDEKSADKRIVKVIQSTQNVKLTAALNASMLNSYLGLLKTYRT